MDRSIIRKEIASLIHFVRGKRVIIDADLAQLYGVETKQLNRAVNRNLMRFPEDFMFQLNQEEADSLRCQFGTSNKGRGGRRYLPYVFTEHGVAMLASVLQSKEAVIINIQIVRAFVAMLEAISTHLELSRKLEQLEYRLGNHDDEIASLFEAIKQLMKPIPTKKKARIGF
jgi:hypothetical protein